MVVQNIVAKLILDLLEKMVRRPWAWVARRWWDQEGLELAGTREVAEAEVEAAVAAEMEEGRDKRREEEEEDR